MRKKPDSSFLGAVLILAVLTGVGTAQKAASPTARPMRLVRVDLLTPPPVESRPVRRDVFSPSLDSAAPLAGIGFPTMPTEPGSPGRSTPGRPGSPGSPASGTTAEAASNPSALGGGEAPVYIPSIRYIGYVEFGRKLTALIIAEGQPLAVEEKEEVLPGYRVVAITAERIEIADPSGTKRSYLREGEQP